MFSKQDIFAQLEKMQAPRNKPVLFHSSLRCIGQVEGGAQGLLDVLIEYFTAEGGLFCVPTHTWNNLGKDVYTLDMLDKTCCLGTFGNVALQDPRGIRSENPTHSMVVFGEKEKAEAFVANEPFITSPTSGDSCYGKLCAEGGYILLAGVGQRHNTYLHCVDEMLGIPDRMTDTPLKFTVRRENGEVVEREMLFYSCKMFSNIAIYFNKYDIPFRYHGCITDGFIGNAPAQLCNAAKQKEVVELIVKNSNGEDPLEFSYVPPKRFCTKP